MASLQGAAGGALSGAGAGAAFGPIGAVGGGLLGGIMGALGGGDDEREKQLQILEQMQQEISQIPLPSIQAQQVVLERYKSAGLLTPEMEAVVQQGPSAMAQITTDARLKDAQIAALNKLAQVGQEGLTAEDRAAMNQLNREVAQQEAARQQGILQSMQQRGISGSGAELASQLASSQAAAQRQATQADTIAAQAQARALDAIMKRGTLGGQMQEQEFGQQAKIKQAQDAIAAFNAQQRANIGQRNIAARNIAQEQNLAQAQAIANQNVGLSNQEQLYNKQLLQKDFENRMKKAAASAEIGKEQAGTYGAQAKAADTAHTQMMQGLGTAGSALAKYYAGQKAEEPKKNRLENTWELSQNYPETDERGFTSS